MFGSLRIAKSRLDSDQRKRYRAAFCASCHAQKEVAGRASSLLTTYDQTVLTLILVGLGRSRSDCPPPRRIGCTALPFRKVLVEELDERSQKLVTALNVKAIEAKLLDDVEDERRLASRVGLRLLRRSAVLSDALVAELGFPRDVFDELPRSQRLAESQSKPT